MTDRELDLKRIKELQGIRAVLAEEDNALCEEISMLSKRVGWHNTAHESILASQRTTNRTGTQS